METVIKIAIVLGGILVAIVVGGYLFALVAGLALGIGLVVQHLLLPAFFMGSIGAFLGYLVDHFLLRSDNYTFTIIGFSIAAILTWISMYRQAKEGHL